MTQAAPGRAALAALTALAALAGCSQILGIEDLHGRNGPPPDSGPPGFPLELSGVVQSIQNGPIGGVLLEFYKLPEEQPLGSSVSSPSGFYSFEVPTGGAPIDGFVRAEPAGPFNRSFRFLPRPAIGAMSLDVELLEGPRVAQLASLYGDNHTPGAAAVFVQVIDPIGAPVAGVAIDNAPLGLKVRYNDSSGTPIPNGTATGPDGLALMFDVPPGERVTLFGLSGGPGFGPVTTPPVEPASCYFITLRPPG